MPGRNNGRGGGRMAPRAQAARDYREAIERGNNASLISAADREFGKADSLDRHYGFSAAEKGQEA